MVELGIRSTIRKQADPVMAIIEGHINKMVAKWGETVHYVLPIGDDRVALNRCIGRPVHLEHLGGIECIYCSRQIKKSFNQGYCFPCARSLARCDMCIVKPETCHYALGTCREPTWGEQHCQIPHTVYLANSSGVKVGITRETQQRTRWMDQGATQALPILTVDTRLDAGRAEVVLKEFVSDTTDWRRMLRGVPPRADLCEFRDILFDQSGDAVPGRRLPEAKILEITYPVTKYPTTIRAHNLDKTPVLEGILTGIKGQYLIVDNVVVNIRKYSGYRVKFSSK